MGETMRALRLTGWQAPVAWQDVPVPEPGPGQVLVEVLATGLCHSDLNVMDAWAGWLDYPLPFTLGHEVAGRVVATGSDIDSHWDGRRVVVHGVWSCRTCRNCLRGRENHCLTLGRTERGLPRIGCGLGWDGGLAPYLLVPSPDFLVRADGVDPTVLAPLADAGLTAYHAVRQHADLLDGNSVCVVVGVGGLGHLALQVLRELGCGTVLAADTRAAARDLAARLGADHVVDDVDRLRGTMRALGGADVVLDFVVSPDTVATAAELLASGGRLVMVGAGGGRLVTGKDGRLPTGWQVSAPFWFWGTRAGLVEVVRLAAAGRLRPETEVHRLEDALDVYARLRRGDVRGRAVVVPRSEAVR